MGTRVVWEHSFDGTVVGVDFVERADGFTDPEDAKSFARRAVLEGIDDLSDKIAILRRILEGI